MAQSKLVNELTPDPLTYRSKGRIAIIRNAKSGANLSAGAEQDDLAKGLTKAHIDAALLECPEGGDLSDTVSKAIDQGYETLIAGGGDGTVSCVAAEVIDTERVLGVLPLGTLNHFAKDLGMPGKLEDALKALANGQTGPVDAAEVNGKVFINNSSIGLYPNIVKQREELQRLGSGKWPAFARALWTVLGRYPILRVTLLVEGKQRTLRTPIVFIGNNRYQIHGLDIGKRETLTEGVLSLYVTKDVGRLGLFWLGLRALVGRLRDSKDFSAYTAEEITIETNRPRLQVSTDGEVTQMQSPLKYKSRPRSLRVILPPTGQTGDAKQ